MPTTSLLSDAELFALLAKAGDGRPHREQKTPKTDGLFPSGAKGKDIAAVAQERGLIESCPAPDAAAVKGKGKAPKLTHVRLTATGREQVLRHLSPKPALEALHSLLKSRLAMPIDSDMSGPLAQQLTELRAAVDHVRADLEEQSTRRQTETAEWERLLGILDSKVGEAVNQTQAQAAPVPTIPQRGDQQLADEVIKFIEAWSRDRGYGCQFDELKAHLDGMAPGLTVGAFQDLLRSLHEAGRVRLGGWGQTLDEIPRPDLALFISHKVMYHVYPGDRSA